MRRKLAAGNWKMNVSPEGLAMIDALAVAHGNAACEILLCPPTTLLPLAATRAADTPVSIGGQTCHPAEKGAHTGDVSAEMLRDAGAAYVIVGHSERRAAYGETDGTVRAQAEAAHRAGLTAIICLGESLEEREAGKALDVIRTQLGGSLPQKATGTSVVIAYEPIWAIGTGKIPTMDEIAEVHAQLRADVVRHLGDDGQNVRLLYGGSVKPDNAADIFGTPDVDGALVGGASLKTEDFSPIIAALDQS